MRKIAVDSTYQAIRFRTRRFFQKYRKFPEKTFQGLENAALEYTTNALTPDVEGVILQLGIYQSLPSCDGAPSIAFGY
jgi:hypothetical protein